MLWQPSAWLDSAQQPDAVEQSPDLSALLTELLVSPHWGVTGLGDTADQRECTVDLMLTNATGGQRSFYTTEALSLDLGTSLGGQLLVSYTSVSPLEASLRSPPPPPSSAPRSSSSRFPPLPRLPSSTPRLPPPRRYSGSRLVTVRVSRATCACRASRMCSARRGPRSSLPPAAAIGGACGPSRASGKAGTAEAGSSPQRQAW